MNYILITLLFIVSTIAKAHEISITFDDLPCQQDESPEVQSEINTRILNALKNHKAPAGGFVNEGKIFTNGNARAKVAILQAWIDHGHILGNHTYSHLALSATKLHEFENDVLNGAKISKKLMSKAGLKYQYFRHPYLDTGSTPRIRNAFENFLKRAGYVISPITIYTYDWKFNYQLSQNPKDKEKIIAKYLEHTKAAFAFYEAASQKIFGRNIKHIWLLHVNMINSYAIDDLLKIARERGYEFITQDAALSDKAYAESDNYYAPYGCSWLQRWDHTRGSVVDWTQNPEADTGPIVKVNNLDLFDKSRGRVIPVTSYVRHGLKGKLPIIIISHGYTVVNTAYSSIAKTLANKGYHVLSIQHDLPTDPVLSKDLPIFERRMPSWQRGVDNILFVMSYLKRHGRDVENVTLIGHSQGGDISMLMAKEYPGLVDKVISLDSLRMPFPLRAGVYSLRAGDTTADPGVLPSLEDQAKYGMRIVNLADANHIDMCDRGPDGVKGEINEILVEFLRTQQS